jgi:hypothetical protein
VGFFAAVGAGLRGFVVVCSRLLFLVVVGFYVAKSGNTGNSFGQQ